MGTGSLRKIGERRNFAWLTGFAFLLMFASGAPGALVVPLGLERMDQLAVHIFVGRVVDNTATEDPTIEGPVTYTTFQVLRSFKGVQGQSYTIKQLGGSVPGADGNLVVQGIPRFEIGERYVLFLPEPSGLGFSSPVGLAQGSFAVKRDAEGREVATNGRDFSELVLGVPEGRLPPGLLQRIEERGQELGPFGRRSLNLQDFELLIRRLGQ